VGTEPIVITDGRFSYRADQAWARLPPGRELGLVSQLAVDRAGRVFVVQRTKPAVLVFAPDGSLEQAWHHERLTSVHGVCVAPDDSLFITSFDAHQVLKFTFDGTLLMELGHFGCPRWDIPFNHPTDVAIAQDGEIFVTDGYGNARVHRFAPNGAHVISWGSWGRKPGQFGCPHGIWVDEKRNLVIAVDRDNDRIQAFDRDGRFHEEWDGFCRPMDIWRAADGIFFVVDQTPSLYALDERGTLLGRARMFSTYSHGIGGDNKGNLYIAVQGPSRVVRLERLTDLGTDL
jgi:DNA-binding beta-propeller fold protein YncE